MTIGFNERFLCFRFVFALIIGIKQCDELNMNEIATIERIVIKYQKSLPKFISQHEKRKWNEAGETSKKKVKDTINRNVHSNLYQTTSFQRLYVCVCVTMMMMPGRQRQRWQLNTVSIYRNCNSIVLNLCLNLDGNNSINRVAPTNISQSQFGFAVETERKRLYRNNRQTFSKALLQ